MDYIENPAKTDEKMLVSSFACSYETADIEFELLLSQAMQKGNNLAHHLIQSFAPGETTPEQAHEIGRQLADEVLQGKYPYVLTTHIDKGHVHNHVIFCAVDMVNQRKYVSNRRSYAYIRRTSDRLCKEHGLSVVMPGQDRGKSYAEWDAHRKGTSWKAKLKAAIDAAIPQAKDFDDFLRLLQEQSYEVMRGKYVSFRAPGQERFTRCKTLGEAYTESINVENNSAHYLYSRTYDRIYISLNYNPAHGNDKYCNLTISYNISSPSVSRTFRVKFAENNTMVCEIDDDIELLNVATIIKMLNIIVEDYISE